MKKALGGLWAVNMILRTTAMVIADAAGKKIWLEAKWQPGSTGKKNAATGAALKKIVFRY